MGNWSCQGPHCCSLDSKGGGGGIKQPSSPAMVSMFSSHTALFSHVHSSACVHLCPGSGVSASWSLNLVSSFLRLRVVLKAGLRSVRLSSVWSHGVSAVTSGGVSGGPHICMYSFFSRGENSVRHAGRFIEEKTNGLLCSLEEELQLLGRLSASRVDRIQ